MGLDSTATSPVGELDASRLLCPMPVIRTQDRVAQMQAGQRLWVIATDPGVLQDIPAWCRINGHQVIEHHQQGGEIRILLEVGE